MKDQLNSGAQELLCDIKNCTAPYLQEVEMFEQDFRFCQHHFDELEPLLVEHVKESVDNFEKVS